MSEWRETKLKDAGCKFLSGYAFKSEDYSNTGIPLIKIGNIQNKVVSIDDNGTFIKADLITDKLSKYLLCNEDILIAMTGQGSVGRVGKLQLADKQKALLNQRVGKFITTNSEVHIKYLYYVLSSPTYQEHLFNTGSGSGQPNLSPELILETEIILPPLLEQQRIAEVLSSLDDKIDLLHRQNQTLEQLAETMFRKWFVEEAEESWDKCTIYEYVTVDYGYPFNSKLFNDTKEGIPVIRIRDIKDGSMNTFTTEIVDEKYLVKKGDLLVGMDGEFRIHMWQGDTAWLNQRVCRIKPKEGIPDFFVLFFMKPHLDFYEQTKGGTTVIHLGKSDLDEIRIALYPYERVEMYKNLTQPLFEKCKNNSSTIYNLTILRDTLLPKLMSGVVRVNN